MNKDEFILELNKLNIDVDDNKLKLLEDYYNLLIEYNSHTNVTAITEEKDVYLKHFYDSLTTIKVVDLNNVDNLLDIGSGAGFPGLVLKIFYPHINVTVLDSNNKKTTFMQQVIDKLNLNNTQVINARAEEYAKDHLNEFDVVTSRAVAFIDIITSIALPFVNTDGKLVLLKGSFDNEEPVLKSHLNELNVKEYYINKFNLPFTNDERNLVVIRKDKNSSNILNYSQIVKRNKKWNSN